MVWLAGTAVDERVEEHGVVFARIRERGRGRDDRLAWFEWTLPDAADPIAVDAATAADPESWAATNPSLGSRISEQHVERERRSLDHRSFCAERLGVGAWPRTDLSGGRVISAAAWEACLDPDATTGDPLVLAIDVTPDRGRSAIVAAGAGQDGRAVVELVDSGPGTSWVANRLADLCGRHRPRAVIVDGRSPAASLLPALRTLRPVPIVVGAREYADACGAFYDAVSDREVAHRGDPTLSAAVAAGVKRTLGDAWAWSRRSSTADIAPLVAASLALWGWVRYRTPRRYLTTAADLYDVPEVDSDAIEAAIEEAWAAAERRVEEAERRVRGDR